MSDYWGYVEIYKGGRITFNKMVNGVYDSAVEVDKLPKDIATVVAALDFLEEDDKLSGGSTWMWFRNDSDNPTKCYFIYNKDTPERKSE